MKSLFVIALFVLVAAVSAQFGYGGGFGHGGGYNRGFGKFCYLQFVKLSIFNAN